LPSAGSEEVFSSSLIINSLVASPDFIQQLCKEQKVNTAFHTKATASNMLLTDAQRNLLLLLLTLAVVGSNAFYFQPQTFASPFRRQRMSVPAARSALKMADDKNPTDSPLDRVLSPKIDDRGLPLSDAAVAQIIGPSLQVFWLTIQGAPRPTWLAPLYDSTFYQYRGALLVPTLIHGAALSCCWLLGCLMAKAYEEEAIDPTIGGYQTVLWRIFQAGCFASGCLIFSTQIDLLLEFGRWVQFGENPETDSRILTAAAEVTNDIFFSILSLVPMRLYLAASIAKNK